MHMYTMHKYALCIFWIISRIDRYIYIYLLSKKYITHICISRFCLQWSHIVEKRCVNLCSRDNRLQPRETGYSNTEKSRIMMTCYEIDIDEWSTILNMYSCEIEITLYNAACIPVTCISIRLRYSIIIYEFGFF